MRTTIDAAGRLVIPKAARDELDLAPGTDLELRVVDRQIEIEVPVTAMRLVERGSGVVAVTDREMPVLTVELAHGFLLTEAVITRRSDVEHRIDRPGRSGAAPRLIDRQSLACSTVLPPT